MKKLAFKLSFIGIHAALIATALIVTGVKASTSEEASEKFTGKLETNCVIRVLENDTAIKQGYFQELIDAFNEEYAEYGIQAVDANMDQYTDLEKDGPYGYGPDVLYQANDRLMKYVEGHHILPLPEDKILCLSSIGEQSLAPFTKTVDGTEYLFSVPVNIQSSLLYYRKDLLPSDWKENWDDNKNDVPDMLETFSALYKYSMELKNDGNPDTYGYMRSFLEPYFSAGYLFSYGGYCFGDNNTNPDDIGFSAGDAYKGVKIISQLSECMDKRCVDDTITLIAYSELAKGNFFATITTPDVYTLFVEELKNEYGKNINVDDYLGVTKVPTLPLSGDLTDTDSEQIPCKMMGGVHGYAISSYTKYPNASLAFVNFATSYSMIERRSELLGIVPAREDVAASVGGLSQVINEEMEAGNISVMASISAVGQIWTPLTTLFQDIALDTFTEDGKKKYATDEARKQALVKVDEEIYNAIHVLG